MSLGAAGVATMSPGVKIGNTWYDYQHNGSMGRMIDWGWDEENGLIIHFSFMNQDWYPSGEREYAYNCYYGKYGSQLGETGVQPSDEYGGGVGIDVTVDNRAVLGGRPKGESFFRLLSLGKGRLVRRQLRLYLLLLCYIYSSIN